MKADVELTSGSRMQAGAGLVLDHAWTDSGIAVATAGTGAHLLLVSVGVCVLNDVYREAQPGVRVDGVLVRVVGDLDAESWSSASISYDVELDSPEDGDTVVSLLERVDAVAEIPRVLRGDVTVART